MGCRAELVLRKGASSLLQITVCPQALGPCIITQQHWRRLLDEFAGFSYGEKIDIQFK